MTKDDALKKFYENNNIDPNTLHPCDRIANLPQKIDDWLSNIHPSDHPVFLEALSKYTYLTQEKCKERFITLVQMLESDIKNYNISLSEVLYVSIESSSGIKSGGDNVRADMQFYNFNKINNDQILAVQAKFSKSKLKRFKAVVFVDDIIGTGQTIWSSFKSFCKAYFSDNNLPKLYYMCLSPTQKAIEHLNNNFKKENCIVTGLYKNDWISHKAYSGKSEEYKIINNYEKMIDAYFKEEEHSYRMGFKRGCLLLSLYYNTPNNTISIFWRPTSFNKPPFERQGKECRRPKISHLKAKKNESKINSYSYFIKRNENGHYNQTDR